MPALWCRLREFQVVPPCGGHRLAFANSASRFWFQVVPPCGGHHIVNNYREREVTFQVVPPCGGHLLSKLRVPKII